MALNLIEKSFRGVWQCRSAFTHNHKCEHCGWHVHKGDLAVAVTIIRNGVSIVNYLAHEQCHVHVEHLFFDLENREVE